MTRDPRPAAALDRILRIDRPAGSEPTPHANRVLAILRDRMFHGLASTPCLGRYQILGELGRGAMGAVYRARDPELDREVAVKVVRSDAGARDDAASARLQAEAQALARLSHPNVVPVYDVGMSDGEVFIAMELVRGVTLTQWAQAAPRAWTEIRDAFLQAAQGLSAAHKAGLVHRDFKPANVIVGDDGRVRVVDFGLACARPDEDTNSAMGGVAGTPAYMAPEQHAGGVPDARSDQYACCVALYELLFGERPFRGSSIRDLHDSKRSAPAVPAIDHVPPRVRRAIARGLEPDPGARWPCMDDLLEELRTRDLERYELAGRLATGGMAELFLARPRGAIGLAKKVVLKRLLPHLAADPEFARMFENEARIAARLDHPNIVQVHDAGRDGHDSFFVMEYIHGHTLEVLCRTLRGRGERIPLRHALTVAVGIAAGLHHAHELRDLDGHPLELVHRDVSPSNVMIAHAGGVKLLDFGIARVRAQSRITRVGTRKGKAGYMSPEQCNGAEVDRRTDIFALAVLLFEMTTMTRAFDAANELATMRQIVDLDPPRPSQRVDGFDPALDEIIVRAMARNADERYQTARHLQVALERLAAESGLTLSPSDLGAWSSTVVPAQAPTGSRVDVPVPTMVSLPSTEPKPPRRRSLATTVALVGVPVVAAVVLAASLTRRDAPEVGALPATATEPAAPALRRPPEPAAFVPADPEPTAAVDHAPAAVIEPTEEPPQRSSARKQRQRSLRKHSPTRSREATIPAPAAPVERSRKRRGDDPNGFFPE